MNKSDTFVLVVAALSEKLVQKENEAHDLRTHIDQDRELMEDMKFQLAALRTRTEEMYDLRMEVEMLRNKVRNYPFKEEECDRLANQNQELWTRIRHLESANYKLRFGGQTTTETATAYMKVEGEKLWATNKIATIKVVREITLWGLKETKDWCESYMKDHLSVGETLTTFLGPCEQKEESGPGTKRSSQIPAGVGESVKKSA